MLARIISQLLGRGGKVPEPLPNPAAPLEAKDRILAGQQAESEGRMQEAARHYEAALAVFPDSAGLYHAYGNVLRALGRNADAIAAYRKTLAMKPNNAKARNNLGVVLCAMGNTEEGTACFREAAASDPDNVEAHENLGGAFHGQGRLTEALASYRQVLRLQPHNGNAAHMVAALTGENSARAPGEYVAKVFDGYSDNFETHLVQSLKYDIPRQLASALAEAAAPGGGKWDVLDLGCGSGLVGVELQARAGDLVGVDVSAKMLDKARAKDVYTRLEHADLAPMMQREADHSYDVVTAADVFVYLGRLDETVAEAHRLLRYGGLFGFSVEALDPEASDPIGQYADGYRLAASGRYSQSSVYLAKLAAANGFVVRCVTATPIREENRVPVKGWLMVWQKAGSENPAPVGTAQAQRV